MNYIEHERKFTVSRDKLPNLKDFESIIINQFYIPIELFTLKENHYGRLSLLFNDKIIIELLSIEVKDIKEAFSELKEARLRIISDEAFLTLKSHSLSGIRKEFEWIIYEVRILTNLLNHYTTHLNKTRYKIPYNGVILELDKFDRFPGYLLEIENCPKDFELPSWVDCEVTNNQTFYNINLAY